MEPVAPSSCSKTARMACGGGVSLFPVCVDGRDGSVTIHADARLCAGRFDTGTVAEIAIAEARHACGHVARGRRP